jgi:hypothetical protein
MLVLRGMTLFKVAPESEPGRVTLVNRQPDEETTLSCLPTPDSGDKMF